MAAFSSFFPDSSSPSDSNTDDQREKSEVKKPTTMKAQIQQLLVFMDAEFVIPGGSRLFFTRQEEPATEEEEELQEQRAR